jgi:RimJ/RimL family protein N-acetyltransferase
VPVRIATKRLLLRNFAPDDWRDLLEVVIDKQTSQYAIYDQQFPTSEDEVKRIAAWFAAGDAFWAVCELSTLKVIGYIHLGEETERERNLGYCLHSAYWGKGYATEACVAAIDHAFDSLGVQRITSGTASLNLPSVRLLLSLGFRKTGEASASFARTPEGKPIEFVGSSYLLDKGDWIGKPESEAK